MPQGKSTKRGAKGAPIADEWILLWLAIFAVAAFVYAYWPTLGKLVELWNSSDDYQHGYLVAPLAVLFLWLRRESFPRDKLKPQLTGLLLVLLAGVARWVSARLYYPEIDGWTIPLWIAGAVALLGGWRLLAWSWPAIAFLWFMVNLPERVERGLSLPLQNVATACSTWILQCLGAPAVRQGTTILLGAEQLEVERACSGLRIFYGIGALAIATVIVFRPPWWQRLVMAVSIAPVAVFANVLRVVSTGETYLFSADEVVRNRAHDIWGLLMIPLAVVMFLIIKYVAERIAKGNRARFMANLGIFAVAGVVLAVAAFFWHRYRESPNAEKLLAWADEAEAAEDPERVRKFLNAYLRVRPDDTDIMLRLADHLDRPLADRGSRMRSLFWLDKIAPILPDRLDLKARRAKLALALFQWDRAADASRDLLDSLGDPPDSSYRAIGTRALAIAKAARLEDTGGDAPLEEYVEARYLLQDAIEFSPGDDQLAAYLAIVLRERLTRPDARERETMARETTDAMLAQGVTFPSEEAQEAFRQSLQSELSNDPNGEVSARQLTTLYVDQLPPVSADENQRRSNETMATLTKAGISPNWRQRRFAFAEAAMDRMIASAPDSAAAYLARYRYRKAYHAESDDPLAKQGDADLDKAIELASADPNSTIDVWLVAADRARARKQADDAKSLYERAIQANPTDHRGYLFLGGMYAAEGTEFSLDKAIEIWKSGRQKATDRYVELTLPLADVYVAMDRNGDAETELKSLDKVVGMLPRDIKTRLEMQMGLVRANLEARGKRYAAAAARVRRLLKNLESAPPSEVDPPVVVRAWTMLGDFSRELNAPDQAAEAFEKANQLAPNSAAIEVRAASACDAAGRMQAALDHYQRALSIDDKDGMVWLAFASALMRDQAPRSPEDRDWRSFDQAVSRAKSLNASPATLCLMEADRAALDDKGDIALALLEEKSAQNPDSAELWQALALAHVRWGTPEGEAKALAGFEKASKDVARTLLLRATLAARRATATNAPPDEAIRVLQDGLKNAAGKEKAEIALRLAALEASAGDREKAKAVLEELAIEQPQQIEIAAQLAQMALEDRDWGALDKRVENLHEAEGDAGVLWKGYRARGLMAQVTNHLEDPRFTQVATLANELTRDRPSWPTGFVLRGLVARQRGDSTAALEDFIAAQEKGERSIEVAENLIELYFEQGDYANADEYLKSMRDFVDRSSRLASIKIERDVTRGQVDDAIALAQQWIKASPDDPISYVRLGHTLEISQNSYKDGPKKALELAEQAFRQAVAKGPTDSRTWFFLFRFYDRAKQDRAAALKTLSDLANEVSIAEGPKAFVLGQLYDSVGEFDRAAENFARAADLAPNELRVLERATAFFLNRDGELAERYCREALRRAPGSTWATRALIGILAERDESRELAEAFTILDQSIQGREERAVDRRLRGWLLMSRGRPEDLEAAKTIFMGLSTDPQGSIDDRARLAKLYEDEGRLLPAHEQWASVAAEETAAPRYRVMFVRFLQAHAVQEPQYLDEVEQVIRELQATPGQELQALDLQLDGIALSVAEDERATAISDLVDEHLRQRFAKITSGQDRHAIFESVLILLARRGRLAKMAELCERDPPLIQAAGVPISLANALVYAKRDSDIPAICDEILSRAVAAAPDDSALAFAVANARYMHGKRDEAIALYRLTDAKEPDHPLCRNNLALALAENGAFDEALATIEAAIAKSGPTESLLDTKTTILAHAGRGAEALPLTEAIAKQPRPDPGALFHRALALQAAGDSDEARATLLRAKRRGLTSGLLTPGDWKLLEKLETVLGTEKS